MRWVTWRAATVRTLILAMVVVVTTVFPATAAAQGEEPTLSAIEVLDITATSARITWTVDRPATGQIAYGETPDYGRLSDPESSFDYTTHVQRLSDLDPGTTYHFSITSVDESGRSVQSSDRTFTTLPLATPATEDSAEAARFGSAVNADSLWSTSVGGPGGQRVAYRFRATETAALEGIRVYILGPSAAGHGAGTGGVLRVSVRPDDGSDRHRPTGIPLASVDVFAPTTGVGNEYAFEPAPQLQAGTLYHIVFENIDQRPEENYVSVYGLWMYDSQTPRQPRYPDSDWGQLTRSRASDWREPEAGDGGTVTPIMALEYANGAHAGLGYIEVWAPAAKTISGSRSVRQRFLVDRVDRAVASVSIRLARLSGGDPLSVRVETSTGELVASGKVPATSIPRAEAPDAGGGAWARLQFEDPFVLTAGQRYQLTLSTDAATEYSIFSLRTGVSYGYPPETYFELGGAEYDDGTGWVAFDPGWRGPLDESDLQFYFE